MDRKKWKKKLQESVYDGFGDFDADNPPCPDCGATMNFYGHDDNGDFPAGEGYWECPSCKFRFSEDMMW